KKKKVIIISSIIGVLLLACGFILLFGFRKPTEEYLKDYFTGPDPNHEDVAGVPDYYHFWYYIQGVTGENGVYCRVTDVDIIDSEFSFFKGKARVKLTTEDEYLVREIYADLKLSGLAGNWNIDKVETKMDDPDNKIIEIKDEFYERLVWNELGYSNKYGLDEFEEDRLENCSFLYDEENTDTIKYFSVDYDVSNVTDGVKYDGYLYFEGYFDINPDYSNTDYRTNVTVDDSGVGIVNADYPELPVINNEMIYFYSNDASIEEYVDAFESKYPEYKNMIIFDSTGSVMNGQDYVDIINGTYNTSRPASLVAFDTSYSDDIIGDWLVDLNSLGLDEYYGESYEYTRYLASRNGAMYGMCPNICPQGFIYRKDIAEEVLGTSDPEVVRTYLSNWDTFGKTAELMKAKGYKMVCCKGDLYRGFGYDEGEVLNNQQMDIINRFVAQGYLLSNEDSVMWSEKWQYEGMNETVFGYFGPGWMINSVIDGNSDKLWGFCPAPEAHYWGGTIIGITDNCPNKGLAALFLAFICSDTDLQISMAETRYNTPNNKTASQRIIDEGLVTYSLSALANEPQKYYDEIARKIEDY
ncbi:MAG: ABC transporter substrate-binding protein, partial [Eubacterium sp.]|nr:ABC transporter substrate-binding protein [Eubacterium sp.]